MSPDDDWALGQNEVDVRNEARRARLVPSVFVCQDPESAWIEECRALAEREDPPYNKERERSE